MNPDKWKSVVVAFESYKLLKDMAQKEHRTISGQFTYILEKIKEDEKLKKGVRK